MATISDVNEAMKVPLIAKGTAISPMSADEVRRLSPFQKQFVIARMQKLSTISKQFKEDEIGIIRDFDEMVAQSKRDEALRQLRQVEAESRARRMASRAETARKMEEAAPLLTGNFMIGRVGSDDYYLSTLEDIDFEAMSKAERKSLLIDVIQAFVGPKKIRYLDPLLSRNYGYETSNVRIIQTPKTASIEFSTKEPDDEDFEMMARFKRKANKLAAEEDTSVNADQLNEFFFEMARDMRDARGGYDSDDPLESDELDDYLQRNGGERAISDAMEHFGASRRTIVKLMKSLY
jgi:hypothetical protein